MIFVDDQIPHLAEALASFDNVQQFDGGALTNEIVRASESTALFVRSVTRVDQTLLTNTSIRFVGTATAGIDHIDVEYLASNGIAFASAPGSNANAVAEYVMDSLDELGLPPSATIGIVGFGNVGGCVARYACMRGMRILVNDPPLHEAGRSIPRWCSHHPLAELMEQSDVVTLHVPYTHSGPHATQRLITADLLCCCAKNTLIINTARGGILDERTLADLVTEGRLRAVLDVFAHEPNIDPYVVDRVKYCTPHIAGYTYQAKKEASRLVFEAFTNGAVDPQLHNNETFYNESATRIWGRASTDPGTFSTRFEELRKLWPLRNERHTPPTWEECDATHP